MNFPILRLKLLSLVDQLIPNLPKNRFVWKFKTISNIRPRKIKAFEQGIELIERSENRFKLPIINSQRYFQNLSENIIFRRDKIYFVNRKNLLLMSDGSFPCYSDLSGDQYYFESENQPTNFDHYQGYCFSINHPKPRRIKQKIFSLLTPGAGSNYYHFLHDFLPKLYLYRKEFYSKNHLIVCDDLLPKFREELIKLEIIPDKQYYFLSSSERIIADDVSIISPIDHHPSKYELIPNNLTNNTFGCGSKKIFVSRNNAKFRKLVNEDQLCTELKKANYIIVELDGMSIAEQVQLFQSASHIISVHGAALGNLIFCQPQTKVIEIIGEHHHSIEFWIISNFRNLVHHYFQIPTNETWDGHFNNYNLEIKVDDFMHFMNMSKFHSSEII